MRLYKRFLSTIQKLVAQLLWDSNWFNVVLLMHMEDTLNSQIFSDVKQNIVDAGGATVSSLKSKFGNSSMRCTTGYATVTYAPSKFDWWTSDHTVEMFVYINNHRQTQFAKATQLGNFSVSGSTDYWSFGTLANGRMQFYYYGSAGGTTVIGTTLLPTGTWHHLAMVKTGNTIKLFANGVLEATATVLGTPSSDQSLGLVLGQNGGMNFDGYIDEVRISKGVARYTSAFTPPTAAFLSESAPLYESIWSKTVLYLTGNGVDLGTNSDLVDSSPSALTIVRAGNVSQGTYSPFAIPKGYWSTVFDGVGDYLTIADSPATRFESDNFTLEFWFNTQTISGTQELYTKGAGLQMYLLNGAFWIAMSANNSTAYFANSSVGTCVANTWNHVALVRNGNSFIGYFNGVGTVLHSQAVGLGTGTSATVIGGYLAGQFPYTGAISNVRLVKSAALYTTNFEVSTVPLEPVANTVLHICSSSNLVDLSASAATIYATGDVKVSTQTPFNNPNEINTAVGSAYFDGVGDYIQVPSSTNMSLGTSDFTLECWVNRTSYNTTSGKYPRIFNASDTWMTSSSWCLTSGHYDWGRNKFGFHIYAHNGNTSQMLQSTTTIVAGNWYHVAVTRQGSTFRMFVNGILEATATWSGSMNSGSTNTARIGGMAYGAQDDFHNGYISNLRLSKGIARYTASFTPSIAQSDANTSLLLNFSNGQIVDRTGRNVVETVGNAKVTTSNKVSGTGSIYLDGAGDYINIVPTSDFAFGTQSFTIEFWVKFIGASTYAMVSLGSGNCPLLIYKSGTQFQIFASSNGSSWDISLGTVFKSGVEINTWYHVAVVRDNGRILGFCNGVLGANITTYAALTPIVGSICVGAQNSGATAFLNGYIDNLRITKGVARYVDNFTPQMSDFPSKQLVA